MSLSSTYLSRKELFADNLNTMGVVDADKDDGLTTLINSILDIPNKQSTTLTIDVPLNLEYGDNFNITGSLTGGGDGVSGATIKLKVGSTVVDTATTDGTGAVSFTQCPVAVGNHSFQLIFDGDLNHNSSESTVVTREVGKETTVITLNSPVASSNHYAGESISVSGVFTDNDNTAIASATLIVKVDGSQVKTLTTGNDGSFSDTITIATAGSKTVSVEYETTTYYTACTVSRSITVVSPSLVLSSTKSILSYADHEEAVLSAQLNSGDNAGKTVSFDIVDSGGNVIANIGTGTTNSSGYATCSSNYVSTGAGDILIQASQGMIFSERYELSDILKYDDATTDKSNSYDKTYFKSSTLTYSNGYYTITPQTDRSALIMPFTVGDNIQIDIDVKINAVTNEQFVLGLFNSSNTGVGACSMRSPSYSEYKVMLRNNCTPTALGSEVSSSNNANSDWHHITFKIQGNNVSATINGVDKSLTSSLFGSTGNKPMILVHSSHGTGTFDFKNYSVKAL